MGRKPGSKIPSLIGNKFALGNEGGRPTKYSPEMVQLAYEYLKECVDEETERIKSEGDRSTTYQLGINAKIPTVAGLALKLKVSKETIYQWKKENKEFSDALEAILTEQERKLIDNSISGKYNPLIAKLLLVKHGYVDRQELTGKDGEKLIENEMSYERAKAIIAGEGSHTSDSKE